MTQLLADTDPPVFQVAHEAGASPFVLTCDHAGRSLPRALGDLGLSEADLGRHIAWDIGIGNVGRLLADQLDAYLILHTYSRLVIDCNRPPGSPQSIVQLSEATDIPGNIGLSEDEVRVREQEVFWPYHRQIAAELDRRAQLGLPTIFVALHSFTPVYLGHARPMHMGVLYQRDARVASRMLELLRREPGLLVGDNEPYFVSDATDYSVVNHGEKRGLLHVELELRQDLISDAAGQRAWADRLAPVLSQVARTLLG
ncbi:MAG TPA: N-formylglutamate amidohydrolase [Polyangiales bacterium]|nr:N-formylglutamate amidohydrolase [Polyangiales bacterium]